MSLLQWMLLMPWCESCDRHVDKGLLSSQGGCPSCGKQIGEPSKRPNTPWHFWVVAAGAALYLGWRAVELVVWIIQQLLQAAG